MQTAATSFRSTYNATHCTIICPWAELGVAALKPSQQTNASNVITVPAHFPSSGRVVDTLAAGDCFIAAVVHFMNEKIELEEVLKRAVYVAGESVGRKGLYKLSLIELAP